MIKNKINFITAILININIMIGAGIFMNTAPLTKFLGSFGFVSYLLGSLLLLPIVLTIAKLAQKQPVAGGLYIYNKKNIGDFTGFLSGWSYFLGKTASTALLCNTFVLFFQNRISFLQKIPLIILDLILIFILVVLNSIGLKIGGKIQYFFASAKFIPIIFVIFTSLSIINPSFFAPTKLDFQNLFNSLPITIFAMLGFEVICSIGHMIENPKKNIPKVIVYSFIIVVLIASIFQLTIFLAIGHGLTTVNIPIFLLGSKLFKNYSILPAIINALVFTSILGGAFGNLTSNVWNLYSLAKDKFFPISEDLSKLNKNNIPYIALATEGTIALLLLAITKSQVSLQNMTVLGVSITYILSSISLFKITLKENFQKKILPILAILSSSYMIIICIQNIIKFGVSFAFLIIFFSGILFSLINYKKTV